MNIISWYCQKHRYFFGVTLQERINCMEQTKKLGTTQGLYDPRFEHDNCGIGAVVNIKGIKSHRTVADALKIVENLEHRAGKD